MVLNGGESAILNPCFFMISPPFVAPTGEFYGHNYSTANLELIAEFFETYPGYAERAFLSIKVRSVVPSSGSRYYQVKQGGLKYATIEPDCSCVK